MSTDQGDFGKGILQVGSLQGMGSGGERNISTRQWKTLAPMGAATKARDSGFQHLRLLFPYLGEVYQCFYGFLHVLHAYVFLFGVDTHLAGKNIGAG